MTRYEYDEQGDRIAVIHADGHTTSYSYNQDHLLTSITNPLGHSWRRAYNGRNQIERFSDPMEHSWYVRYDDDGHPSEVENPLGAKKRFAFERGISTATRDWSGVVTRLAVDGFGRITERDIGGRRTSYRYDAGGNVVEVLVGGQTTLRASYDVAGNLTKVIDGHGHSVAFRHGPCRRLLERIDRLGGSIRYDWGTEPGRLIGITNEKGEQYTLFHDELGRVVRERSFDAAERHFSYDADGHVVVRVNANGEATVITRDPLHRPVRMSLPGEDVEYSFDANGNLASAKNADATVAFERDPLGRITREVCGDHWVNSRYDALGHLVQTTTSLGLVAKYAVDANGAATTLTTHGGSVTEFIRNAHGQETARQMPGARLDQRYDDIGRLVEQRVMPAGSLRDGLRASVDTAPGLNVVHRQYAYDRNSAVTAVIDQHWGRVDYRYDPGERLLEALRERGPSERLSYDSTFNVSAIHSDDPRPSEDELEYLPGNRLARKGDTAYQYDAEGRRIRMVQRVDRPDARVWTYEWDAQDRLVSLTRPDGERWNYKYDALGRRVGKSSGSDCREYLWDKDVIVHEHTGTKPLSTWMFEAKTFAPIATIQKGQLYSIVCDQLGSPKELINSSGDIALASDYAAWGSEIARRGIEAESIECPIRSQGQWFDQESGLCYNRFRYFDPSISAFVSQDPIGVNGGINLYAYGVNPCNFVDPTGLCAAGDLPPLKGKNEEEVRQILRDNGFTQDHVSASAARNETWSHPDGSEVRIHPYGNQNEAPYRSANNAHVHKESPTGQQLTDRGIPSTNPAETHVGIRNPPDLPAVRGRPHGAGVM